MDGSLRNLVTQELSCHCSSASGKSLSHVRLFGTPWNVACQAPLSIEFSRQEYWSELIHRFIYVRPLGDLNLPTCMVTLQQQWGAESGIPRVH